jgi:hypothetical protein
MLDAIHGVFKSRRGLFNRLMDHDQPAITFELLPLEHFGLTDDLYIKMNARGKPLTSFETFKARFEELLKGLFPTEKRELSDAKVSIAEFFERRIDTRWTDFFWAHKPLHTQSFDELIMNLLLALARVSLDPGSRSFSQDTTLLREKQLAGTFPLFHEHGWCHVRTSTRYCSKWPRAWQSYLTPIKWTNRSAVLGGEKSKVLQVHYNQCDTSIPSVT